MKNNSIVKFFKYNSKFLFSMFAFSTRLNAPNNKPINYHYRPRSVSNITSKQIERNMTLNQIFDKKILSAKKKQEKIDERQYFEIQKAKLKELKKKKFQINLLTNDESNSKKNLFDESNVLELEIIESIVAVNISDRENYKKKKDLIILTAQEMEKNLTKEVFDEFNRAFNNLKRMKQISYKNQDYSEKIKQADEVLNLMNDFTSIEDLNNEKRATR